MLQTFLDPSSNQYSIARPISITFRGGLVWTFQYGTYGQLTSITDSFGKVISFTWVIQDTSVLGQTGVPPRPAAVSTAVLPDGTTVRYVYESTKTPSRSICRNPTV